MSIRSLLAALTIAVSALLPSPGAAVQSSPRLIDQTGHAFTFESLRGRPLIVTFVSAHCTDACPLVNAQFSDAAVQIAHRRLNTRLLTITLDPINDPPSLMATLAHRFGANPRYWLLASGRPADVNTILNEFGVVAKLGKSGFREQHTTFVYVLGADGKLQNTMLALTGLSGDIVQAARSLQPKVGK